MRGRDDDSDEEHHYHYIPAQKPPKPEFLIKTWTKETCPDWTVVKIYTDIRMRAAILGLFKKGAEIVAAGRKKI